MTPVGFGVRGFTKDHDANKKLFDFGKALGVKYLAPTRPRTASTASTSCARSTRSPSPSTRTARRGRTAAPLVVGRGHHEGGEGPQQADRRVPGHRPPASAWPNSARSSTRRSRCRLMGDAQLRPCTSRTTTTSEDGRGLRRPDRACSTSPAVFKALQEVKFRGYDRASSTRPTRTTRRRT